MNSWLQLSSRLRLGLLVALMLAAICSWGWNLIAERKPSAGSTTMQTAYSPPAVEMLHPLTPMQLQQSLQRSGTTLQQISFNNEQAQVQLQSTWQPFIDLVSYWSGSSLAPIQYQLEFSDQLNARMQLNPGRFRAASTLPSELPTLLAEASSAQVREPTAPAVIACTVEPPPALLAALWPSRGYALVQTGQQMTRVATGDSLNGTNWIVSRITGSALHLTMASPPAGCNEPPRHTLPSTQYH